MEYCSDHLCDATVLQCKTAEVDMANLVILVVGLLLGNALTSYGFLHQRVLGRQTSSLLESFRSGDINFKSEKLMKYFELPVFLIVGASEDRSKFGNKVLRCMLSHKRQCIPLNKRLSEIEGIPTIDSMASLAQQLSMLYPATPISMVGMNLITPPAVTLSLMKQGYEIGIRNFFCQPGTVDGEIESFVNSAMQDAVFIEDCVLVQLNEDHAS